jgi:hypothetical protein
MVPESGEWSVPTPLRTLLWWPPLAFVLAMVDPSAAAHTIALTGAVLATLGLGVTAWAAVVRRMRARAASDERSPAFLPQAEERMTPAVASRRAA